MHSYRQALRNGDRRQLPPIDSFRFHRALDLVALAEIDPCLGWQTWPEVWHLDESGRVRCHFRGSSLESIHTWAHDPSPLHRSRFEGLRTGGCTERWVIVDSRPTWFHAPPTVDESDAQAFLVVGAELASIGVSLLDMVVFDDNERWWSLLELVSGTTEWPAARIVTK